MSQLNNMEQYQLDALWSLQHKYFAQFENISLPLGGFNMDDVTELYLLVKDHLVKNTASNIRIADVGCWTGMSSTIFALLAEKFAGKIYAIDWFQGSPRTNLEFAGSCFDIRKIMENNINQFSQKKFIEVMSAKSLEASAKFEDNSLDVVFLDADHRYEHIKDDINHWLPKVKKGGLLCGHDCEMILEKGLDTLYEFYNNEDIISVLHLGVCRAISELGGQKTRTHPPYTKEESMKSGIWYYVKP